MQCVVFSVGSAMSGRRLVRWRGEASGLRKHAMVDPEAEAKEFPLYLYFCCLL